MRQYINRLYGVCKAVIVGVMVAGLLCDQCRHFGVMPGEYRHPAGLFAALCHNAFVRKRGKRGYAVGKKRRPFRLKQSRARHSFSVNSRVLRACTKAASLEGCLIDDAYKALRERAKSSAYKSRWLSKALSA